jgi:hypothetical protein
MRASRSRSAQDVLERGAVVAAKTVWLAYGRRKEARAKATAACLKNKWANVNEIASRPRDFADFFPQGGRAGAISGVPAYFLDLFGAFSSPQGETGAGPRSGIVAVVTPSTPMLRTTE